MKNSRKEYYQNIINELLEIHGEDKFTYRLFGEHLNFSKQRAKQIVDHYQLDIPLDIFDSPECADLKLFLQSNEVTQYTIQELYEDRYKKVLPLALIRSLVIASGKVLRKNSDKALYGEYLSKTKTEEKTKCEMFAEVQAMFPKKTLNYSSFCSDLNLRKLPFKRKRKESLGRKNESAKLKREKASDLLAKFLASNPINLSLYSISQLHVLHESFARNNNKPSIEYPAFRKAVATNKIPLAKSKPLALLNRLLDLGIDLKAHETKEIARIHNEKYPQFSVRPKMLNDYLIKSQLWKS